MAADARTASRGEIGPFASAVLIMRNTDKAFIAAGAALRCIVGLSSRQGDGRPCPRCDCAHTAPPVGTVSGEVEKLREEVARARDREIAELRARLKVYETQKTPATAVAAVAAAAPSPTSSTRQLWYWTDLVMDSLRPFQQLSGGITREGLRLAEQKCKTSTYCHRAQVIGGRLYVTDLRAVAVRRRLCLLYTSPSPRD